MRSKSILPIAITHGLIFGGFTIYYLLNFNLEFLIYIVVIVVITLLVYFSHKKLDYSHGVLWALVAWGAMHMAGGGVPVGDGVLYQVVLLPLSENYPIFRFDQLVHMFGFGACVFVMRDVLKIDLKTSTFTHRFGMGLVLVMGAMGFGALNEVIEFSATVVDPNNGVGGYVNNALDLVFNLLGALVALFILRIKENKKT